MREVIPTPASNFPYFYGSQSEQFSFYRIPKLLMTDPRFRDISTDAKLLYGLLLDRMSLSSKNDWQDETGRVFVYFTAEETMSTLNCREQKAAKIFAELDQKTGIGLIERIRQGQGKPSKIYVKNFAASCPPQTDSGKRRPRK